MDNKIKRFRKWQKSHPNFMTPHPIKVLEHKGNILELSEGIDFEHKPIYGVTVAKEISDGFETNKRTEGTNQMFYSKSEAFKHINYLRSLDIIE